MSTACRPKLLRCSCCLFASVLQLARRAEARERYWKGVVREVQRVASEDSAELRKRCQAAVDGKNEQIRHFRERLNAIVATVHEQSLRRSVESGVGALEALAV